MGVEAGPHAAHYQALDETHPEEQLPAAPGEDEGRGNADYGVEEHDAQQQHLGSEATRENATHQLGAAGAPEGAADDVALLLLRQPVLGVIGVTAIGIGQGHDSHAHVEPLGYGQGGAEEEEQHLQVPDAPSGTCGNERL